MATIHVDGKSYEVNGSENLLHVCLWVLISHIFVGIHP
jgi:NADH-quinone oxidoreductase subunit G